MENGERILERRGLLFLYGKNDGNQASLYSFTMFALHLICASRGLGYANLNTGNTVTTIDLFKWIVDAAKGLEFLERKKVIHGDIATRNILLAYGKIAKISDFGLAKKLYQYTTVVKEEVD